MSNSKDELIAELLEALLKAHKIIDVFLNEYDKINWSDELGLINAVISKATDSNK